ncbi:MULTISPECIES: DUF779 domain-containing protein [Cellulosimicrobium]|uniref:DUF779 domain-containing protein n=1 Tax=Cellulosimicrobium sp. ES-005 TaxID=3163031 RepID=A0AAU8FYX5_9MICO|nr:DUF779 domain-containing protein [Cellulosimicrobium cellulans]MCO7272751.1 DUF779 domain-containing protein [Cellulosimicrobium cellulans]
MPDDVPSPHSDRSPAGRVALTDDAAALLARLRPVHGELMFHQSGGCCDGSSPMCYPQGDFLLGDADVHLGDLAVVPDDGGPGEPGGACAFTVPVWMSRAQFEYWKHTHLTIDVVPGRGAGFSVEAPEGVRFIIRSRLLTDDEWSALHVS